MSIWKMAMLLIKNSRNNIFLQDAILRAHEISKAVDDELADYPEDF